MKHYFEWVGVVGDVWGIVLGGWGECGWVDHYFGWLEVG